jgi:hypothetical protein
MRQQFITWISAWLCRLGWWHQYRIYATFTSGRVNGFNRKCVHCGRVQRLKALSLKMPLKYPSVTSSSDKIPAFVSEPDYGWSDHAERPLSTLKTKSHVHPGRD